eukprot:CAMPEP_0114345368 /NCGR_PEP_ID=MMETSP0101-20121206/12166_1 /TAXON_ID=38822 ORGANISM="Pteridomonas danica, Strain PT" /NCGR_SAMPLE_ID=MMETSP0101 /ASSEMBLY_ACC=CAM_ASM_000211 /LENGTH=161 /DNA_ID=CAMNT_0001481279 /DNA_START=173 /DNA_END=655 /DNA_ORIENTATION=+
MESKQTSEYKSDDDKFAKGISISEEKNDPEEQNRAEEKESRIDGQDLIQKVCDFYFDDEPLQNILEHWAVENSKGFSPLDTEYSLEQMTLFEEFRTLLESKLESHVLSLGASIETLHNEISRDTSKSFYSGNTLVEVINASVNFKNFHNMMCDARAGEFIW